jgi:AcrR family transcriptional regulator
MATRRKEQKAATLKLIEATARRLFSEHPYEAVTIRRVAAEAGLTSGAIFRNYPAKADLWRGVMGTPPPLDSALTRTAGDIEKALRQLVRLDALGERPSDLWTAALGEARDALARLDGDTLEPVAGSPPRATRAAIVDQTGRLEGPLRTRLVVDVLERADRTGWQPVSEAETARALAEALSWVRHSAGGVATDRELYAGAVEAASRLLIVAARGVAAEPAAGCAPARTD